MKTGFPFVGGYGQSGDLPWIRTHVEPIGPDTLNLLSRNMEKVDSFSKSSSDSDFEPKSPVGPPLTDAQLIAKMPPLLRQVMERSSKIALTTGTAQVKPIHVTGAMISLLEEKPQWHVPAGRRANKALIRQQREMAEQLAEALLPGVNKTPEQVAKQLRPILTHLEQAGSDTALIGPAQLHPAFREVMEETMAVTRQVENLPQALVRQMLAHDDDGMVDHLSRTVRQSLETAHRVESEGSEMNADMMDTAPLDFFSALKEKSPVLHKWVEAGSGSQRGRAFDQFQPGPLPTIVSKGLEMANREITAGKRARSNGNNGNPGKNLESLNALIPAEMRKKIDRAHLANVVANAQRKLAALPLPVDEESVTAASQQVREVLEAFIHDPQRQDFSIAAFVAALKQSAQQAAQEAPPGAPFTERAKVGAILGELIEEAQDKRQGNLDLFEKSCPTLAKYGVNLVKQGLQGNLPEVLMRREATDRMLAMINAGGERTNILLNTGSGEGKTFAVMGLAQRIANDDVPPELKGAQMVQLDFGSLLSESMFRGEFEKRALELFGQLSKYVTDNAKRKVIVFMDEIHMLGGDEGAALVDIMKSSGILEHKNLTFIGATTPDDWQKSSLRNNHAFQARFHELALPGFSADEKLAILGRQAGKLEKQAGVEIQPEILENILKQSVGKWPENALRRSIDIMRLSASLAKGSPLDLASLKDRLQRKELWLETLQAQQTMKGRFVRQLTETNREVEALRCQIGHFDLPMDHPQERTVEDQKEVKRIAEKILKQIIRRYPERAIDIMRRSASLDKESPLDLAALKDRLQSKELWLEILQDQQTMKGRFVRQLTETNREVEALRRQIEHFDLPMDHPQERTVVRDKHVKQAIAVLTGEKIGVLNRDELNRLRNAKEIIGRHIVGQPEALAAIEEGLREIAVRQKTGGVRNRPIVSMLLPGPTGVGKTEVAKVIAKEFMNNNFIRLDMSDYMEKHALSLLTGAPPGYVGFENGGLVDQIRKNPQSVIVFDEIEKAHPDIFNVLLQILEEGELRDNQGRPVSFRNAVIALTSNLNNEHITTLLRQRREAVEKAGHQPQDPQMATRELESQVRQLLTANPKENRQGFRPEHLGRIDYVIPFSPLSRQHVSEILDIRLREMNQEPFLKDNNLQIQLSDRARQRLIELTAASGKTAGGSKESHGRDELPLQGGARDVRNNFERFVYKKVFTDLTFDPRLSEVKTRESRSIFRRKRKLSTYMHSRQMTTGIYYLMRKA